MGSLIFVNLGLMIRYANLAASRNIQIKIHIRLQQRKNRMAFGKKQKKLDQLFMARKVNYFGLEFED